MADPAWGAASSSPSLLPNEPTAQPLYPFRSNEPLSQLLQRHQPLLCQDQPQPQQQLTTSLYQPLPTEPMHVLPPFGPDVCATADLSRYGHPSSDMSHVTSSMCTRREEIPQRSMDRDARSLMDNSEWLVQQENRIQVQLEQQVQEQQLQLSMQEQTHRQADGPGQSWYSLGADGFNSIQSSGSDARCLDGLSWRVQGGGREHTALHRDVWNAAPFCNSRDGSSGQSMIGAGTALTVAHLYMLQYGASVQGEEAVGTVDGIRAQQQIAQSMQAYMHHQNCRLCAMSIALYRWARSSPMLSAGVQMDRVDSSRLQETEQFIQQQPPQRESCYPAESCQPSSSKEISTSTQAGRSSHDDTFLDSDARHFSTNTAPAVTDVPAGSDATCVAALVNTTTCTTSPARDVSAGFDATHDNTLVNTTTCTTSPAPDVCASPDATQAKARANTSTCITILTEDRIKKEVDMGTQGPNDTRSRSPIRPSRAAVVPGVSLASHAARLLTMQDILNGEDGSSKTSMPRLQLLDGKQKQGSYKRKMPTTSTPTKRQKMPDRQSEDDFQQSPANKPAEALLQPRGVSASAIAQTVKPCTPMYLAFMESRAARASKQVAGTKPSVAGTSSLRSQLNLPARGVKSSANSVKRRSGRPNFVNTKTVNMETGMWKPLKTSESDQRTKRLRPDTTRSDEALYRRQVSDMRVSVSDTNRRSEEPCTIIKAEPCGNGVLDGSIDEVYRQRQWRQLPPEYSVHDSNVVSSIRSSIKTEMIGTGKDILLTKRRTARLPCARPARPTLIGRQQQAQRTLPSNEERHSTCESSLASAIGSAAVSHGPAVNRTVVIFCKRDFMRYQAAKIWRKYQEQLTRHEEWQEVRVAGKRTRYLKFRYDDEIQRTYRRTYTRSGKARRKPFPKTGKTCSHQVTTPSHQATTDLSVAGPMISSSAPSDKGVDERGDLAQEPSGTTSELSMNIRDDCMSSGKCNVAKGDEHFLTRDASQSRDMELSGTQGDSNSAMDSSVSTEPSDVISSTLAAAGALVVVDGAVSEDGPEMTADAGSVSDTAVSDALSSGTFKVTVSVPHVPLDSSVSSVSDVSRSGNLEVMNAITDRSIDTPRADDAFNETGAPFITGTCKTEVTCLESDGKSGVVVVADESGVVVRSPALDPTAPSPVQGSSMLL
uniref:Uncharacterized protein n=1 Tax=Hyaloperonospora arabidopsidis (strain Emoy2) TaxID=559515 RepID=M4BN00_HYAAE